jgi:MSHA pilin protein MshC
MTAEIRTQVIRVMKSGHGRGFTIVELVVIISILGLMAAVIGPRFAGRDVFASRGFYDQAITTVRMAQKIAIAERANATPPKTLIFVVVDANSIRVCRTAGCSAATEVINPATGAALAVSAPSGVTLSPVTFSFNGLGQPSAGTTIALNSSIVGDPARQIIVTAETGYVTRP